MIGLIIHRLNRRQVVHGLDIPIRGGGRLDGRGPSQLEGLLADIAAGDRRIAVDLRQVAEEPGGVVDAVADPLYGAVAIVIVPASGKLDPHDPQLVLEVGAFRALVVLGHDELAGVSVEAGLGTAIGEVRFNGELPGLDVQDE